MGTVWLYKSRMQGWAAGELACMPGKRESFPTWVDPQSCHGRDEGWTEVSIMANASGTNCLVTPIQEVPLLLATQLDSSGSIFFPLIMMMANNAWDLPGEGGLEKALFLNLDHKSPHRLALYNGSHMS